MPFGLFDFDSLGRRLARRGFEIRRKRAIDTAEPAVRAGAERVLQEAEREGGFIGNLMRRLQAEGSQRAIAPQRRGDTALATRRPRMAAGEPVPSRPRIQERVPVRRPRPGSVAEAAGERFSADPEVQRLRELLRDPRVKGSDREFITKILQDRLLEERGKLTEELVPGVGLKRLFVDPIRKVERELQPLGDIAAGAIRAGGEQFARGRGVPVAAPASEALAGGRGGELREAGAEFAGGVPAEIFNPINLVPIPIVDPLVARVLGIAGRAGARVTRAVLSRLASRAGTEAGREGVEVGVRAGLQRFAQEAGELTRSVGPQAPSRVEPGARARGRPLALPERTATRARIEELEQQLGVPVERGGAREAEMVQLGQELPAKARNEIEILEGLAERDLLDADGLRELAGLRRELPLSASERSDLSSLRQLQASGRPMGNAVKRRLRELKARLGAETVERGAAGVPPSGRAPEAPAPPGRGRELRDVDAELELAQEVGEPSRVLELEAERSFLGLDEDSLARELESVEFELRRREIPFGGRAGISPAAARRERLRGRGLTQAKAEGTTDELVARQAVLSDMLAERRVPARTAADPDSLVRGIRTDPDAPRVPQPVGGAAEAFAAPLRPMDTVASEVVTQTNPILRALAGRSGVNPAVLMEGDVGRGIVAYWRQRIAGEQLSELAVGAALDTHAQAFTGRRPNFRIVQTGSNRGDVLNVTSKSGKRSLEVHDVFSRPDDYNLTTAQRAEIDDFHRVIDEMEFFRVQVGLKPRATRGPEAVREGWLYTPRQTKTIRGVELRRPSNPGLQRHYEQAVDGRLAGIEYDIDLRATADLHVKQAYREIIDKQFSDHIERLQARAIKRGERIFVTPKELVKEPVLKAYSDAVLGRLAAERNLRALQTEQFRLQVGGKGLLAEEARAQRTLRAARRGERAGLQEQINTAKDRVLEATRQHATAKARYGRALEAARKAETAPGSLFGLTDDTISIRQWRNRFFRTEDAERLRDGIEVFFERQQQNPWLRGTTNVANSIRFLSAVGDVAEPFIQGQLVFGASPTVWARSALRHYQALFDPTVQSRFMREFLPELQEMAQHGTPIGDPEFFAALRPGEGLSPGRLLELVPKGDEARRLLQQGGRQTFGRFQASYNTGLMTSRAMLTKTLKNSIPDAAERQASIRNLTGGLDSRALGVGPGQRSIESFLLAFSPRLLRSTVALVGDLRLGLRNPRGRVAWKSLITLAAATTGIYVLTGLALGKSWEEIGTGLNPLEGKKFLSQQVNGDWIGIGGQTRALVQLLSHVAVNIDDPQAFFDLDQFDNPLVRFYMSRGAVGVSLLGGAVEAVTGGSVDVLPFDDIENPLDFVKHVGTSALPFVVQGIMEGEGLLSTGFGFVGGRTSAQRPREAVGKRYKELTGRDFDPEVDFPQAQQLGREDEQMQRALDRTDPSPEFEQFEEITGESAARLLPLVNRVRQGDEQAGARFRDEYSRYKTFRAGVAADAFFREEERKPDSEAGVLLQELRALDPLSEEFLDEDSQTDWGAFDKRFDGIIDQIDAIRSGFRAAYEARLRLPEEMRDVEELFLAARKLRDKLGDTPKYRGLSVEAHDELKDFRRTALRMQRRAREERGMEMGTQEALRRLGRVQKRSDSFVEAAILLGSPRAQQKINPDWLRFLVENVGDKEKPGLRLFYSELYRSNLVIDALRELGLPTPARVGPLRSESPTPVRETLGVR